MWAIEFFIVASNFLGTSTSWLIFFLTIVSLNFTVLFEGAMLFVICAALGFTPSFKTFALCVAQKAGENTKALSNNREIIFLYI